MLLKLADSGEWQVLVKPHPQQDIETVRQIRERLVGHVCVSMVPAGADTRQLIVASDMIVGFQTTGLAEAMAAQPVLRISTSRLISSSVRALT